jgi:hypothetical protein
VGALAVRGTVKICEQIHGPVCNGSLHYTNADTVGLFGDASMTDICRICGQQMKEFDIVDKETGEVVGQEICCPDEWRESHNRART